MTEGIVLACPECDEAAVQARIATNNLGPEPKGDERYRCNKCAARFDEPVEREPYTGHHTVSNSAKVMADMTVEEFDREVLGKEESA